MSLEAITDKMEELDARTKEMDFRFNRDLNNHKDLTKQRFSCVQRRIVRMERNVRRCVYFSVFAWIFGVAAIILSRM